MHIHPISFKSILMQACHQRLGLRSILSPSGFATFLTHFFIQSMCVTVPTPVSISSSYRHLEGRKNNEVLRFTGFSSLKLFLLSQVQIFFIHCSCYQTSTQSTFHPCGNTPSSTPIQKGYITVVYGEEQ
jgi:hypothetical protein